MRRSGAQGVVDPQVLEARDLIASGQEPPRELIDSICGGNAPLSQTRELCWVATPMAGGPAGATPQQQAEATAYDYFHRLPLPKPTPVMSASSGICGATHSLDLQMPAEKVYSIVTPQGTLVLHAYAMVYVDWGDRQHSVDRRTGAPWPNSSLTHSWTDRGRYDIDALVSWTADWSIGNIASGQIGGAWTRATIDDWPVMEAQAVLQR